MDQSVTTTATSKLIEVLNQTRDWDKYCKANQLDPATGKPSLIVQEGQL